VFVGTSVEVDAFADEYSELALDAGSTKLVVEALANPLRSRLELMLPLPGEGAPGATLLSLSFDKLMFLGLENSFILEPLLLGSLSGGGGIIADACIAANEFGEGSGLLPLGKAAFAAVAAASLLPPSVPLLYGRPPADDTCGLCVALGNLLGCPLVLIGARPGYDRFRSPAADAGGEIWCMAACAAICDAVKPWLFAVA